jgi:hypothetical protein
MSLQTVQQHVHDSAPGLIGTGVAGGFTIVGFVTKALPVLQAISLLIGCAVGIVTFLYYLKNIRHKK